MFKNETPEPPAASLTTTPEEPRLQGKMLREQTPRSCHAAWEPPANRRDPIELLIESSADRVPRLLPIRYGRMLQSPFSFYRGAASIMAADIANSPTTGLKVQVCGDCHLLNFGAFATPERRLVFDINDFDETIPGPWEWDVKRLATSFIIASRHNNFSADEARDAALSCLRSYRRRMAEFASMTALEVWYAHIDLNDVVSQVIDKAHRKFARDRIRHVISSHVAAHDFPKLTSEAAGSPIIRDNPPLIYHPEGDEWRADHADIRDTFARYRESLPDERRVLLDRYKPVDVALKVVGVGSVGTRCAVMLLMAGPNDPLFLQIKEARTSVWESSATPSPYENHGQRVVVGQRLMQTASDMFLGWTKGPAGRDFYFRQLRDMKIKPLVEVYHPQLMSQYASACGWALARAMPVVATRRRSPATWGQKGDSRNRLPTSRSYMLTRTIATMPHLSRRSLPGASKSTWNVSRRLLAPDEFVSGAASATFSKAKILLFFARPYNAPTRGSVTSDGFVVSGRKDLIAMNCVEVTQNGNIVATLKFKGMPINQFGPATFPVEGRMLTYECDPPGRNQRRDDSRDRQRSCAESRRRRGR